jgi:hypothetical protein
MSATDPDHGSSHSPPAIAAGNSGSSSDSANPLWLLVGASALFFAIAAGLLVSG